MRNKILISLGIFLFINNFIFSELKSKISNNIVVKVGNDLITSVDIKNEIITNLIISKQKVTQETINGNKDYAVKNLISKSIKRAEVNKYSVTAYNKNDLRNYALGIAKKFNTNIKGLKKIFKGSNINYETFEKNYETELLWNSFIFNIYKNQININIVEVANEVKVLLKTQIIEYNISEIEILKSENEKQKIDEVFELIKKEGFEVAAKKLSIAKSSKNSGLLGWVSNRSFSKTYLDEIKRIKINEISSPMNNKNSITIFRINNLRKSNDLRKADVLKDKVLARKKQDKLNLFSRSHFSNLENTIAIKFK
tara:strand:- start:990 stop:1922 length:933 start_codon:yes stop_codon:yes gene_type:complete